MTKQHEISAFVTSALARRLPKSQEEICSLAAHASVHVGDVPVTAAQFLDAALGMARGLFGPAFHAADDANKALWIDMCERALRDAAGADPL